MSVIARLEFELAYYDVAEQNVNFYTKKTPPKKRTLKFTLDVFSS